MTSQCFLLQRSSSSVSHFLINRPNSVTSACLLNIEKGKTIELSSITEDDAVNGVYSVKSKKGMYKVQIQEGDCSCPYFTQSRIPCKHIFSIIQNFRWRWEDLPHSLTESPFMTLDRPNLPVCTMLFRAQKKKMWSLQGMQECGLWSVPILFGQEEVWWTQPAKTMLYPQTVQYLFQCRQTTSTHPFRSSRHSQHSHWISSPLSQYVCLQILIPSTCTHSMYAYLH